MTQARQPDPDLQDLTVVAYDDVVGGLANREFLLLGILPPQAFALHHIPGSVDVPLETIDGSITQLFPDKNQPLVAYCNGFG